MEYQSQALRFFREVVESLMLADLDNMTTKIPVIENAGGNCNFPITLFIFSCIEFLGYLTSKELYDGSVDYTKNRVLSYIDSFFGDNYKTQMNTNKDLFVEVFRHGLSHEFFAKAAGVSRRTGTLITTDSETGYLVLDADEFYQAFKASTAILKEKIAKNEDDMCRRIISRYNSKVTKNVERFPPKFIVSDTRTPSAGASLARPVKGFGTASYPIDSD